ncbi:MAG: hypothetical protein Phyf2KO_15570 [Phycisphaerales bacterium]
MLRRLVDLICVLVICAIAYGAVWMSKRGDRHADQVEATRASVVQIQNELVLRSQSGRAALNPRGWSETIVPAWFGGELPANLLLDDDRPWMEIASVEQAEFEHPRPLFDVSGQDASFWYNPALGIVRARVPMLSTDAKTLDAYNTINGVNLGSISPTTGVVSTTASVDIGTD